MLGGLRGWSRWVWLWLLVMIYNICHYLIHWLWLALYPKVHVRQRILRAKLSEIIRSRISPSHIQVVIMAKAFQIDRNGTILRKLNISINKPSPYFDSKTRFTLDSTINLIENKLTRINNLEGRLIKFKFFYLRVSHYENAVIIVWIC